MPAEPANTERSGSRTLWQRLGWFVAIWVMSVTALGVVAYGIRMMIV